MLRNRLYTTQPSGSGVVIHYQRISSYAASASAGCARSFLGGCAPADMGRPAMDLRARRPESMGGANRSHVNLNRTTLGAELHTCE
jgi:hypothetical protein